MGEEEMKQTKYERVVKWKHEGNLIFILLWFLGLVAFIVLGIELPFWKLILMAVSIGISFLFVEEAFPSGREVYYIKIK